MPTLLRTRYLLGFGLAALILLSIGAAILVTTRQVQRDGQWVHDTYEVISRNESLRATLFDGIAAQRSYLLSGEEGYYRDFVATMPALQHELARLAALASGNPRQTARIERLGGLIVTRMDLASQGAHLYQDRGLAAAQQFSRNSNGIQLMQDIRLQMNRISDTERMLLAARTRASQRNERLLLALAVLGLPLSIGILSWIYVVLAREARHRLRAERDATSLNRELSHSVSSLERATADLRELSRYASLLQGCRTVPEALDVTRRTMHALLPEAAGAVYLMRASLDYAEMETAWGEHPVELRTLVMPDECWAMRRGKPHIVDHVGTGMRCEHVQVRDGAADVTTACLPLGAQNLGLGCLMLSSAGGGPLARVDIAIAAAEQLSLALANLRLQESLRQQSIRDALTGLYNRRYLEESLGRELARCRRRNQPLTLMMLDLDHFKNFNDAHGHDGGDALLAAFGQLLLSGSRAEDIACRYGGEEFTLILPETDQATALQRAEGIRAAVQAMTVSHLQRTLTGTTVSIGMATFPAQASEGDALRKLADAALYRAKRNGRNRAEVAEPA